jgi:hypothetical protein
MRTDKKPLPSLGWILQNRDYDDLVKYANNVTQKNTISSKLSLCKRVCSSDWENGIYHILSIYCDSLNKEKTFPVLFDIVVNNCKLKTIKTAMEFLGKPPLIHPANTLSKCIKRANFPLLEYLLLNFPISKNIFFNTLKQCIYGDNSESFKILLNNCKWDFYEDLSRLIISCKCNSLLSYLIIKHQKALTPIQISDMVCDCIHANSFDCFLTIKSFFNIHENPCINKSDLLSFALQEFFPWERMNYVEKLVSLGVKLDCKGVQIAGKSAFLYFKDKIEKNYPVPFYKFECILRDLANVNHKVIDKALDGLNDQEALTGWNKILNGEGDLGKKVMVKLFLLD